MAYYCAVTSLVPCGKLSEIADVFVVVIVIVVVGIVAFTLVAFVELSVLIVVDVVDIRIVGELFVFAGQGFLAVAAFVALYVDGGVGSFS